MKRILTFLLVVNIQFLFGQDPCENYCLNFEDTSCLSHLTIDTITFPLNIWQIGQPQKPLFDSAASPPNSIVTDTLQPYPAGNYSVFTIRNIASMGDIYGLRMFVGQYAVQTDSLNDYGLIEFSPDNGSTWIDIINDTLYSSTFLWYSPKPVLTGNSNGWKYFDVSMADIGSVFNIQFGDTLLLRFSFISDSIAENQGGLMYDNLCFTDFVEGISETRFKPIKSKIFPNPVSRLFNIEFENPDSDPFQLSIYDIHSKLTFTRDNISENKIVLDAQLFEQGSYIYKLTNWKAKKRSWGKFVVSN